MKLNQTSLRASVLGANDGILSTGALLVGMISAHASPNTILLTGAGAVLAGAFSMAAGEYVSVKSQEDSEHADLRVESESIKLSWEAEEIELAKIYESRGVEATIAIEVAEDLMEKDALGAHARDELGINARSKAHPWRAALSSALSFVAGAIFPLTFAVLAPSMLIVAMLGFLGLLGAMAAKFSGASWMRGAIRVMLWGGASMSATWFLGTFLHFIYHFFAQ